MPLLGLFTCPHHWQVFRALTSILYAATQHLRTGRGYGKALQMLASTLHGFLLALGLILPLGPQNAFVLSQGATQPTLWRAAPAVVAAGICDTLLILLAVLGVSVAVMEMAWLRAVLVVVGVGFLVVMGWLTWRAPAPKATQGGEARSARRQAAFAVAISLGNPHAIIDTIGVIGTSSLAYAGKPKIGFTAACVAVSWLWFLLLAIAGRLLSRIDAARALLNRFSAVVMWVSAAYLALSVPI